MKLNKEEKAICKEYSRRDEDGKVHCNECPLAIESGVCKKTMTAEEYKKEYLGGY